MKAVIMAGGKGTRLSPDTLILPKPLLPIGGEPIIVHIVRRLIASGARDLYVAVGYLGGLIESYLTEFEKIPMGVRLAFVREDEPLGTAGPLALIEPGRSPVLVTNGDVLTDLDYRKVLETHRAHGAAMTVATCPRDFSTGFGTLEVDDASRVVSFREKIVRREYVNMGVYACGRPVWDHLGSGGRVDVPELVVSLLNAGERVIAHKFDGMWHDLGTPAEFAAAAGLFSDRRRGSSPAELIDAQNPETVTGAGQAKNGI